MKSEGETMRADDLIEQADTKYRFVLPELIAAVAVWANPAVVEELRKQAKGNPAYEPWYPNTRRAKPGEQRRTMAKDGEACDDNTKANQAIKRACGLKNPEGFSTCHIWKRSTYDVRFHTHIAIWCLFPEPWRALLIILNRLCWRFDFVRTNYISGGLMDRRTAQYLKSPKSIPAIGALASRSTNGLKSHCADVLDGT
jgi:hypothetical protein